MTAMPHALCGLATALLLAPLALATDPAQPTAELLLTRGSSIPGSTVGAAYSISDVDHGAGSWIASVSTGQFLDIAVLNGVAGDAYAGLDVGGAVVNKFEASLDVNASGYTSAVVILEYPGPLFDAGILLDDTLVIVEGTAITDPGLPADSTWQWFQGANLTDDDRLVVSGWVTAPSLPPGDTLMLIVSYDILPGGTLGATPTLLRTAGDMLGKHTVEWLPAVADMGWEATASGHLMHTVGFEGNGLFSGPAAIALDDTVLAVDGEPSIVPGRNWKLDAWANHVDVAETGSWAFVAEVEGSFDGLDILVHDDVVVALEGQPVPGTSGTELRSIYGPRLSDNGQLAWAARWTVDGEVGIWHYGLFLNDQLVVEPGLDLGDGLAVELPYLTARQFDLAPDGSSIVFVVLRDDNEWGLYELELGPWVSQGHGLAGAGGLQPKLGGHGDQGPGSEVVISLYDALPSSTAHAILGLTELGLPHKGGVLCPTPDVLVFGIPIDGNGELQLPFTWPTDLPAGVELWWQLWVEDAGGPKGFSATNCLKSTTP
jgi:hypothetical protein